jgi:hypothetical protein
MRKRMSDREGIVWAAGLFEGEGCLYQTNRKAYPGAALMMTDEDVVRKFVDTVGMGGVREYRTKPPRKPTWRWEVYGFEKVQALIAMFWPFLGERRQAKAQEILAAYHEQRKSNV